MYEDVLKKTMMMFDDVEGCCVVVVGGWMYVGKMYVGEKDCSCRKLA